MHARIRPPLVLAYHSVAVVDRVHDPGELVVSPDTFRSQVGVLRRRGYEFVTVSEFVRRLRASGPPDSVCALTFDDGSQDNAGILVELLESLGVPATLYVCPGLLGRPHPFLDGKARMRLMSTEELQALARLPFVEIGSHTLEHVDLAAATEEEAYRELASSKQALEDLLGQEVGTFAYPYCRYSPACPAAARRAGYASAVTCAGNGGWLPYELRRELISPIEGRIAFELKSRDLFYPVLRSRLGPPVRRARSLLSRLWP